MWGVGECHEFSLFSTEIPAHDLLLEMEFRAVIYGSRKEQIVDVSVNDRLVATWQFSNTLNQAVRTARIGVNEIEISFPELRVRFAPRSIVSPNELDTASEDTRKLGLGVVRLRVVEDPVAPTPQSDM